MSYIECENLALGYEGKAVVSGLNFKVNKGDYLCVLVKMELEKVHL